MNDRMAEGVEGAKQAVLICVSKKYQDSGNCQKGKVPKYMYFLYLHIAEGSLTKIFREKKTNQNKTKQS